MKNIKDEIEKSQEKYLQSKIYRSRWSHIRASGIDDCCTRRLYYYLTAGELANDITTDLVAVFEEGKNQEPQVRRYLSELGFEVIKSQLSINDDRYNISGMVDGIINYDGVSYITEIKTVSETAWEKLKTKDDFLDSKFYRKWYGQIQLYMYLFEYEKGIFILKRKQANMIRVVETDFDYEYAEKLLQKAETVNTALKDNTPPEFLKNNPIECKGCPFFGVVCNPPIEFGDVIVNIEDIELAKKLDRREALSALREEYEGLDKEVKDRLRGIPFAICGNFSISGKEGILKKKACEASEIKTWKTVIERI